MTGVTVVTTLDAAGAPRGFTANSFTSVSLEPPLLLVCLAKQSRSLATFTEAQGFAVNVLAEDQREISMTFARPGEDRFSGIGWHLGPQGSPVLDGVSAWFDCARHEVVDAGDHVILVGRVAGFETHERGGLGYARGAYFTQGLADRAVTAAHAARVMVGAIIEGDGGVLLVRDGAGWGIPRAEMGQPRGPVTALDLLVGGLGLIASVGFVYAIYEDRGVQHIVYRCECGDQATQTGRFQPLDTLDPATIADPAVRSMLARYADERRIGQFGIYLGDAERGEVRRLAREE